MPAAARTGLTLTTEIKALREEGDPNKLSGTAGPPHTMDQKLPERAPSCRVNAGEWPSAYS
jgi:hypothetical protein